MSADITAKTPHDTDVLVGTRLRARRKHLGLSQTDVANALGLTFQQVQKYERGVNRVSASKLYEIAKLLGVKVEFFFEGLDETEAKDLAADPMIALAIAPGGFALARAYLGMKDHQRRAVLNIAVACTGDEPTEEAADLARAA